MIIPFVNKKPIIPILGTYLLHFKDNNIYMTATDGNHQVTVWCNINCSDDVRICVDGIKFHKIIDSFYDTEIKMTIKGSGANGALQKLVITSGKSKHELPITDPLAFPVVKKPKDVYSVTLGALSLISMWNSISSLVNGKDDVTPQMTGINISKDGDRMVLEGGSSFRFAVASINVSESISWSPIILSKDITSRAKDIFTTNNDIVISHDGKRCTITDGISTIETRSLEGKFPAMAKLLINTESTFSKSNTNGSVLFSSNEVTESIKRLQFHKSESFQNLCIDINNTGLTLVFNNSDTGTEGNEEISISGSPCEMKLGVQIDTFDACIRACNSLSVELKYYAHDKPRIIVPTHSSPQDFEISLLLAASSL